MDLGHDLRYAVRSLAKSPLLTGAAVLTLGLGIGANAAMFEVVDRIFFRPPLHVVDPGHVVRIEVLTTRRAFGPPGPAYSLPIGYYPRYEDLQERATSFSSVAGYGSTTLSLGLGADAEPITVELVTASWFPLLGVRPVLGRFFTTDEDRVGAGAHVAVISRELWKRRFDGSAEVLGRTLDLGEGAYTVIGVAPAGFAGIDLRVPDVWVPLTVGAPELVDSTALTKRWFWMSAIARLRPGIAPGSATAEATAIYRAGNATAEDSDRVVLASANNAGTQSRISLIIWLSVVCGIVLLIACANVANLLLARAVYRRRELAVRLALGATRIRLAQQLLTESVIISATGGLLAVVFALFFTPVLLRFLLPNVTGSSISIRTLVFMAVVVVGTVILAGIAPALLSSADNLSDAFKTGVREGHTSRSRARQLVLVGQVALTTILLAGAGLFIASLHNVSNISVGFDADHVIAITEDGLRHLGYTVAQTDAAFQRVADRLRREPGVEGVSLAIGSPWWTGFVAEIRAPDLDSQPRFPHGPPYISAVTPEYFRVMGTRILRGRGFTDADGTTAPPVTVISQGMADLFWPHQDAIGKCLILGHRPQCTTVVGVAENTHRGRLIEDSGRTYYIPLAQSESVLNFRVTALLVRTHNAAEGISGNIQRVIQSSFADLPYPRVDAFPALFAAELTPWRLGSTLLSLFGVLGLVLAAVGLYGILSFTVTQRSQEMGIRLALGASRGNVLGLVVNQGLRITLVGIGAGGLGALAAGKAVASQLYGISPWNLFVLGSVAAVLLGVALLASYVPGLRAMRVDPMVALRSE